MRQKGPFLLVVVLLALVFSVSFAASADLPGPPGNADSRPGEVVIGFQPGATLAQMNAIVASVGGTVVQKISLPKAKIWRVRLSQATQGATDAAVSNLKMMKDADPSSKILFAEPNMIRRAHGVSGIQSQSGDPLLSEQWGYYDIAANWITAPPSTGPVIAVIDTGVDYTHPDLIGKVAKGYDFVNADTDPMDDYGHGTHVSGIAAARANNNYGIAGVSWGSKILAIKVLDSQGFGSSFDVALGIIAAANNSSVKVINMSLGGGYSFLEDMAVDYAVNAKGKLLVASAGNDNTSSKSYPAGLSDMNGYVSGLPYLNKVLAVAAHGTNDCKASFSNYGTWVSISAPGVGILSTLPNGMGTNGFDYWDGTSMAAPFVAGAAAVVWAENPGLTNAQVGALLTTNTSSTALNRNGTCWPNDGSTFQRLSLFNAVDGASYQACSLSGIFGYAEDAENGEPLTGAQVFTKQGTTVTGTDYVPYFGQLNYIQGGFNGISGYGLFNIEVEPTDENHDLYIKKKKYAPFKLANIYAPSCSFVAASTGAPTFAEKALPIPPKRPYYWLVVTWEYGSSVAGYTTFLYVPNYGYIYYWYGGDPGTLNDLPRAKILWLSWAETDNNLRMFSESTRISKVLPGTYYYDIWDYWNGGGSTAWAASGITAYVYKWNGTKPVLVQTITPPAGTGQVWHVLTISGGTVTVVNTIDEVLD